MSAQANRQAWDGVDRRVAVTRRDGEPIACAWLARGEYVEPDLRVGYRLGPETAWLYAATVAPEHRRRGVYGRLLRFVGDSAREEGIRRIAFGVVDGNEASLDAHRRWAPERLGRVAAARGLGVTVCLTGGAVRRKRASPLAFSETVWLNL